MVDYLVALELAGYALGTVGAALVFLEFFQEPSYVEYQPQSDRYRLVMMSESIVEYTNLGRVGAFLVATAFALLFLARLLGA